MNVQEIETKQQSVAVTELLARSVSYFASGRFSKPLKTVTVKWLLDDIKSDKHRGSVIAARAKRESGDRAEYERIKKEMPSGTWSAEFYGGRKLSAKCNKSGLLALDFDKVGDAGALKSQIAEDRHVLAAWVTFSGNGLRVLVPISVDADHGGCADCERTQERRARTVCKRGAHADRTHGECATTTSEKLATVTPRRQFSAQQRTNANQLQPAGKFDQSDLIRRCAQLCVAKQALASVDGFPPFFERHEAPARARRTHDPQTPFGAVKCDARTDGERLNRVVCAERVRAEQAACVHEA